jgi:hemoglobin
MRVKDIRESLDTIINPFYDKFLADRKVNYLFTDVTKVNIEKHFPILIDFWHSILLGSGTYGRNAMQPHIDLAKKTKLTKEYFQIWLGYICKSVGELSEGKLALAMKARAQNIAGLMKRKVGVE